MIHSLQRSAVQDNPLYRTYFLQAEHPTQPATPVGTQPRTSHRVQDVVHRTDTANRFHRNNTVKHTPACACQLLYVPATHTHRPPYSYGTAQYCKINHCKLDIYTYISNLLLSHWAQFVGPNPLALTDTVVVVVLIFRSLSFFGEGRARRERGVCVCVCLSDLSAASGVCVCAVRIQPPLSRLSKKK